ncbi:MAG: YceD family protein [Rubrobacter sp.]
MNESIPLMRPGAEVGDRHEVHAEFPVDAFDLYGRHHEVTLAEADVAVTRLSEGLHLDLRVRTDVLTTCDRTLDPTELRLEFGDSEFLPGPDNPEVSVEDWTLDLPRYAERALPNEVPMQVFAQGTEPVQPEVEGERVDPRWRGLGGLFAAGF